MSRKFLYMFLLGTLIFSVSAFSQTEQRQLYEGKIASYTKLANAGSGLLFSGVLLSSIGAGCLISYFSEDVNTFVDDPYTGKYYLGVYGLGIGIDLIIGGAIMRSVGVRKVKQYRNKLSGLSTNLIITPQVKGLTLTYRF
jgi:hypothetical protein